MLLSTDLGIFPKFPADIRIFEAKIKTMLG